MFLGEMRLLIHKTDGSFLAAYVARNESIDLWKVEPGTYVYFTCTPSGNDAFLVLKNADTLLDKWPEDSSR